MSWACKSTYCSPATIDGEKNDSELNGTEIQK